MKKSIKVIFIVGLALGFALGGVSWVGAQEDSNEFTLEEVTVTAQKREENVQKVATNIETISGYELTEMGLVDIDEALRNVSSALVQPVGEEMTVIIRGMDNDSMPGDAFSQVAVTVDGSFSNNWGVGTTGLYDMQRVEVLAGPQGTLYSRNSSGGVINMVSNDPDSEKVAASGSVELGNYGLVNTQGVLNVPLSEAWAVRSAFISTVRDGYADNGLSDADDRSMRLKLGFSPSENLSAVLTYEYSKIGGKSQGNGYAQFEDEDDVDDPWHSTSNGDYFVSDTVNNRFYMNLNWTTPIGTVTFLPSYLDTDRHNIQSTYIWSDGSAGAMGMGPVEKVGEGREIFISPQEEKSYELRMASPDDFFMTWLVGLYYYERTWDDLVYYEDMYASEADITVVSNIDDPRAGSRYNDSTAAFANLTYPITDAFRFTLGGRYTEEGEDTQAGPGGFEGDSDHTDYKVSLEYDLGEDVMVWVDYSTGYKYAAGGNAAQELNSYQAGAKSRLLDNRLQLNATAFYYDYSNFDIGRMSGEAGPDPEGEELSVDYEAQGIGDAILYGLDASADYILTEADRINLSLSYLSAEVDVVTVTYTYQRIQYPDLMPERYIDKGKPLNNAPELSIVGSYEHRFNLPNGGKLTPRLSARYTSKYYLEFYPDAQNADPGLDIEKINTEPNHVMADASLNYNHPSGDWSLNAYVKNITNHAEKTGLMRADLRLGAPRTYGAVLSVQF